MSSSEELLSKAKEGVAFLLQVLQSRPDSHEQYMSLASRITSYVDQSGITSKSTRLQERLKLVQAIQKYAVFDADVDGCQDVARWCERQWNGILHVDQNNAVALQGKTRSQHGLRLVSTGNNRVQDWASIGSSVHTHSFPGFTTLKRQFAATILFHRSRLLAMSPEGYFLRRQATTTCPLNC